MDDTPTVPGIDGLPCLYGRLGPAARDKVSAALDRLGEGVRAGGIQPPRYADIAHVLWSHAERGWESLRLEARPDDLADPDAARAYGSLRMHGFQDAAGMRARLAALGLPRALAAELEAARADAEALAGPLAWLRDRATRLAPAAPKGAGTPTMPAPLWTAQERVVSAMRRALDGLREGFVGEVAKVCEAQCRVLEDACAELRALRARVAAIPKEERTEATRAEAVRLVAAIRRASWFARAVDYDDTTFEVRRHPDAEARTRRFAEAQADEVMALCVQRNAEKLAPLAVAMGAMRLDLRQASVDLEGVRTEFAVDFEAGGGFRYTNSIVYGTSSQGTPYTQYPARFHDVVRPDGSALKAPSEAAVRKSFAGPPPASEDEDAAPAPRM